MPSPTPLLLTPPAPPSPVCLGHFHSVCSPTPSPFVHATQRRHPIRRDRESLARRSFGNELGGGDGRGAVGLPGASVTQLRCIAGRRHRSGLAARHGRRVDQEPRRPHPTLQIPFHPIVAQTCSLTSSQCDSVDNLRHYFLHTLFPVVPPRQTSLCAPSRCDS